METQDQVSIEAIDFIQLKKDVYRFRAQAIFDNYKEGNLNYRFSIGKDIYRFPVTLIEPERENDLPFVEKVYQVKEDVGTTQFGAVEKASLLLRWIERAHNNGTLIKSSI